MKVINSFPLILGLVLLALPLPVTGNGQTNDQQLLTGISGKMTIKIEDGEHYYELEYSFPQPK